MVKKFRMHSGNTIRFVVSVAVLMMISQGTVFGCCTDAPRNVAQLLYRCTKKSCSVVVPRNVAQLLFRFTKNVALCSVPPRDEFTGQKRIEYHLRWSYGTILELVLDRVPSLLVRARSKSCPGSSELVPNRVSSLLEVRSGALSSSFVFSVPVSRSFIPDLRSFMQKIVRSVGSDSPRRDIVVSIVTERSE